jgi:hypothetical protein
MSAFQSFSESGCLKSFNAQTGLVGADDTNIIEIDQ